ncbi:MAG: tol-pal system protein YbgF [Desulfovibrio sp.]|nr:tol-pal system protein YbgF [Desulfovibrio sp.]
MKTFVHMPILALCCALLGACVSSGSSGSNTLNLEQQVQRHEAQLKQLQPSQADTWNQLQAMRQELNTIRGQLDDLQNIGGARALANRVSTHDNALRQVERSMALDLGLGDPMPVVPTAYPASIPANPAAAPFAPAATGTVQAPSMAQPGTNVQGPGEGTWGQPTPQPVLQAPQKDMSLALFDAGVNAYNARKYDEAQRSFADFLKNYPTHNLLPDAQFYLAECYFQRNQFADAALGYDTIIKNHPKSSRAPGAYLKQGISFSKLNQKAAAKARLQELIRKFPSSPEAARAKSFLKTNT